MKVFTDGACLGNPGPGGWAFAVVQGPWEGGCEANTTNQRMEITAVLQAIKSISVPLEIISDSAYVVNCFRQNWWRNWINRSWRNSAGKPVANRDLWEPLVKLFLERGQDQVSFSWVKGHSGNPGNDFVDLIASRCAATQSQERGDISPLV